MATTTLIFKIKCFDTGAPIRFMLTSENNGLVGVTERNYSNKPYSNIQLDFSKNCSFIYENLKKRLCSFPFEVEMLDHDKILIDVQKSVEYRIITTF